MSKRSSVRHDDGGFAHSMTDLMAGVAVTFLLLAAIFMVQADALKRDALAKKRDAEEKAQRLEEQPDAKKDLDALALELGKLLQSSAIVARDPKDPLLLLVIFESDGWFGPGECEPRKDVREKIPADLESVFKAVCDAKYQHIQSIILEGHSDAHPLCRGFAGSPRCGAVDYCDRQVPEDPMAFRNNVRLSAARAQEIFFIARERIAASDANVVAQCLEPKFVISGRGAVEPHDRRDWRQEGTDRQRQRDRRVVLKVRFQQRDAAPGAKP